MTYSFIHDDLISAGRLSGLESQQDGTQFEDALRRLHALEKKLTDQVKHSLVMKQSNTIH